MVEINVKMFCPECKQETVFDHTDDVEQKWYKCKNNHQTKTHLGLNTNIKDGIDYLFKRYDAVIVLEDDLLLTPDSLPYLAYELTQLKNDSRFGAVSCVKGKYGDEFKCWGWGTWKDRWEQIDWTAQPKKKNRDSWDMIVAENFRRKGWYCRCSDIPRVKHIGAKGVHYNLIGYLKEKLF